MDIWISTFYNNVMNICVCIFVCIYLSPFLGIYLGIELLNHILEHCQIIFQSYCNSLESHQQSVRFPVSPHSSQQLLSVFFFFLITTVLLHVNWHLLVVLLLSCNNAFSILITSYAVYKFPIIL